MRWDLRAATLLYREPHQPADADEILVGDVYEFTDPPVKEVDPRTYKCTNALQCFRVMDERLSLQPVARNSWKP